MNVFSPYKRILMLNSCRGFVGGVERVIISLAQDLNELGCEVYGLFEHELHIDPVFESAFVESITLLDNDISSLLKHYVSLGIDFVFIHKCNNPDLISAFQKHFKTALFVHDHDYYCLRKHKYFPIKRINCHLPFNPIVCSLCSFLLQKQSGKLCRIDLTKRVKLLRTIKKCSIFFVLSGFMRDNLLLNGFAAEKIHLLKPYLRLHNLAETSRNKTPIVLYCGQLIRGKGIDLLLYAVSEIHLPYKLRIVGRGNDKAYLERICAKLYLQDKVEFVDWVEKISVEYKQASIVAVPSRWQEPFGLVGIEAFSHAKAVVGFDVGGISQWLKHRVNGLLIPAGNILRFAQAIETLLSSEELRNKMGRAGYEMVKHNYNQEEHLKSLLVPMGKIRS
ncbi:MAG: glycosyltransferase family 4 protein [Candidatus Cloacimonetes bacterium]|nr:glycosyltransferase family 4 protein [Candidatus Cloacimonadota bacterium]